MPSTITAISQGMIVEGADAATLAEALDLAFDYRGDVSVRLRDGRTVDGYIFDRRRKPQPSIRMLPKDSDERLVLNDRDIVRLEVTGKDTAAGKTFESWVKRYVDSKLKGAKASIESDPLD
ncbi:MAG: hypothetical protein U0575_02485 [Phycisphaerales bacterium]